MTLCPQRSVQIQDSSQPSEARRLAQSLAEDLGLTETRRAEAGIIVTEAARNVYLHGGGGEIVLCPWQGENSNGLDILALDRGRGMEDVSQCLRDGYSTAGTPGTGLGAISRLASRFEIYSAPGQGTGVFARVDGSSRTEQTFVSASICLPMAGERESGDSWGEAHFEGRSIFMVVDGLGHGEDAAEAAAEAIQIFRRAPELSPKPMLQRIHDALQKTRGAAAAVAEIDTRRRRVVYAGVGNIFSSVLNNGSTHSMVSHNGTLGHHLSRIQEFSYAWPPKSTLVMQSDGLTSHWDLRRYPGLVLKHPLLIAGVLYRDAKRGRDDATVLVSRESERRGSFEHSHA
jgi:anti-sigma regulatory factor (Ser/Thr protein kinase)